MGIKNLKRSMLFLLTVLLLLLPAPVSAQGDGFQLHMLDVGQGLSILIEADGHSLLYDGGGRSSSAFVISYLQKQEIGRIDYLIASHYDEDHISGLVGALQVFDCQKILCPDYEADTRIYQSFISAGEESGGGILHPKAGEHYSLGGAEVDIVGPESYDCDVENDRSISMKITYGETSFLLCGDTEERGEEYMADSGYDLQADVYVASHHGSSTSNSSFFLDEVDPSYVLISCGRDNSYGHPGREALERFREAGCELYRTDRQGTVICFSDGESLRFDQEPCRDWSTNDPGASDPETSDPEASDPVASDPETSDPGASDPETFDSEAFDPETSDPGAPESLSDTEEEGDTGSVTYVCNENSKKFHYEGCSRASQMKEKNKRYTNETREALISQGYSPCKICSP